MLQGAWTFLKVLSVFYFTNSYCCLCFLYNTSTFNS